MIAQALQGDFCWVFCLRNTACLRNPAAIALGGSAGAVPLHAHAAPPVTRGTPERCGDAPGGGGRAEALSGGAGAAEPCARRWCPRTASNGQGSGSGGRAGDLLLPPLLSLHGEKMPSAMPETFGAANGNVFCQKMSLLCSRKLWVWRAFHRLPPCPPLFFPNN